MKGIAVSTTVNGDAVDYVCHGRETLLDVLRSLDDDPLEIIVVDGTNEPGVTECCRNHACIHLNTRSGRAHQMHAGALQSSGNVIWFLHADTRPSADSIEAIRRAVRAGAFRRPLGANRAYEYIGSVTLGVTPAMS